MIKSQSSLRFETIEESNSEPQFQSYHAKKRLDSEANSVRK